MIESINVTTGQYVKLNYALADIEQRIFAIIIDRIVQALYYLTGIYFCSFFVDDDSLNALFYISALFLNLFIEYISHGQTIGKWMMRVKVVSEDGVPPTFSQCFVRFLLYPIDIWLVGVILINKKSQRLGDLASGCFVVKKQTNKMVKVSLEDDYRYVQPKYKPVFDTVMQLTKKDLNYINHALFDRKFYSQQDQVAILIKKRLGVNNNNLSDREFLEQVRNDYFYHVQVLEEEPLAL
ncbi:MAG TPA: RDD family protein [Paludibacteraceae bacterium]|nr:RDD family protein [Paludibacteraceae bacterium]HPH63250.1 RDD family protein [Paludibacteraceae bacterium]